jgi:hypothetical protein
MKRSIPPRLRKPTVSVLTGALFAAAWLIRGGPLWWVSIMAVIAASVRAVQLYQVGGTDTDEGALAGSRADERQQAVGLKSRALAGNFAAVAAFAGLLAAIVVKAGWWWPFVLVLAVTGFGYLFGLSAYGSGEPDADDDAGAGQPARCPARN